LIYRFWFLNVEDLFGGRYSRNSLATLAAWLISPGSVLEAVEHVLPDFARPAPAGAKAARLAKPMEASPAARPAAETIPKRGDGEELRDRCEMLNQQAPARLAKGCSTARGHYPACSSFAWTSSRRNLQKLDKKRPVETLLAPQDRPSAPRPGQPSPIAEQSVLFAHTSVE
jgi:hypothetical protein